MNVQRGSLSHITIGNDVWVGDGSIIMADVATGSVVGAGSVVTRVFEPFSVLAGVPAALIRRRGADVTASAALDHEET